MPVTVVGKNMFKKETDMSSFVGLPIRLATGEVSISTRRAVHRHAELLFHSN